MTVTPPATATAAPHKTAPIPEVRKVRITDIDVENSTQTRFFENRSFEKKLGAHEKEVQNYMLALQDGQVFDPVDLFHDQADGKFYIGDGFHRVEAHRRSPNITGGEILARIHIGSRIDSLRFALGANDSHGIRRTNKDKQNAVKIALGRWPKQSNVELATICKVTDKTVAAMRVKLGISEDGKRIGADGKVRRLPSSKSSEIPGSRPGRADVQSPEVSGSLDPSFEQSSTSGTSPSLHRLADATAHIVIATEVMATAPEVTTPPPPAQADSEPLTSAEAATLKECEARIAIGLASIKSATLDQFWDLVTNACLVFVDFHPEHGTDLAIKMQDTAARYFACAEKALAKLNREEA